MTNQTSKTERLVQIYRQLDEVEQADYRREAYNRALNQFDDKKRQKLQDANDDEENTFSWVNVRLITERNPRLHLDWDFNVETLVNGERDPETHELAYEFRAVYIQAMKNVMDENYPSE